MFLFLKCIFLIGLIYLWKKIFLKDEADLLFYLFCLLAFNSTIYVDMVAGNISILEQFGLWIAFYFLLKRKLLLFCLSLILIASFKLSCVLFLALLLSSKERKKWIYFLGSSFLFLGIHLISFLCTPLYKSFFIFSIKKVRTQNPSSFIFLKDVLQLFSSKTGVIISDGFRIGVFVIFAVIIILVSWRAYIWLSSAKTKDSEIILICLFCLTYCLIMPRFMNYCYILLIVPAYFIIKRISYPKGYILLFIILILSLPTETHLPGINIVSRYVLGYYPLMLAYGLWGLYINMIFKIPKKQISEI